MIKKILIKLKGFGLAVMVFLLFWFLNSGFLIDPKWLMIQAIFFTIISYLVFKNRKIALNHWFIFVAFLYLVSATLEMFNMKLYSDIASSSGFGTLVILIVSKVFNKEQLNG